MRLHRLEITAFGPFADTVAVDLDALSDAGLFLLAGPTGAGKSSVLDAICFALYGDVPGDRGSAKRLRCDLSPPAVAPSVVLEATLSGRRFRIERSPAWERPKKRGVGTTVQQASVCLLERVDGEWQALSTRLDETGHLVTRLVGMTLPQFCQVALLPQGRFQAFLRARSEDRQALLQQVFRTDRFDRVEKHLKDHRQQLRRSSVDQERVVADLLARVSEVADEPCPTTWEDAGLASVADGELTGWVDGLVDAADEASTAAREGARSAAATEAAARHALERGHRTAELQGRHSRATETLRELAADAATQAARREELDAARRAAAVVPLEGLAERARAEADRQLAAARTAVERATAAGVDAPEDPSGEGFDRARSAAASLRARAEAALPREAELAGLAERLVDVRERIAGVSTTLAELESRAEQLPDEMVEVRQAATDAARTVAGLPAAEQRCAQLRARLDAHQRLTTLQPVLERARASRLTALEHLQAAREAWLAVREARLDGMAAEIATGLAVGHSCPVCGSADHPHPAVAAPGAPDASAEKAARREVDDAEIALQAADEELRTVTTEAALARQQAGEQSVETCQRSLADADADLRQVREAERASADLDAAVVALEMEQRTTAERRRELADEVATARAEEAALDSRHRTIATEVGALLEGSGCDTLAELCARAADRESRCEAASQARAAHARAEEAAATAFAAVEEAARDAGFADAAGSRSASRTPRQVCDLEESLEEAARARTAAEGELADPAVSGAASVPAPDLDALASAVEIAAEQRSRAGQAAARHADRATRLRSLRGGVVSALTVWAPLRHQLALATTVAALVDGTSPDNQLRMRLSAYVLAHRLSQVVAAANVRLATMSDHRYTLEHTGRRGAGESRGGLSLQVRDDWSGERRDPATLSGGETFVVSLALALGLADVITQEAGGADLDTLFVDEGFGSLDADTLDDVMDTLDALRDGGRVVGVVSHVAEMRDRIPSQLRVAKLRSGSVLESSVG